MDSDPNRHSGENIDDLQQARLALRGALESIRGLQDLNSRLKGQIQDATTQEKMLQQRLQDLQHEMTALRSSLQAARSSGAECGGPDMIRQEASLKQQFMDRELALAAEWYSKERRLIEDHERALKDERQRTAAEEEKRKQEATAIRKEWEADLRRQETELRSHFAALLEEQNNLHANLIAERVAALKSEFAGSVESVSKERRELEALSHRQQAELSMLKEKMAVMTRDHQAQVSALTTQLKELEAQRKADYAQRMAAEDRLAQVERHHLKDQEGVQDIRAQSLRFQEEVRQLQDREKEWRRQKNELEEAAEQNERRLKRRLAAYEEALQRLNEEKEKALDTDLRVLLQTEIARLRSDSHTDEK